MEFLMLTLNWTDILKPIVAPLVENYWWALLLMIVGGIVWYMLRFDFTETYRERKRHTAEAIKWIAIPAMFLVGYLFLMEYYWILSFLIAGAVVYILDQLGLIDLNFSR
jgi:Na+/H+ antiporter NhaC